MNEEITAKHVFDELYLRDILPILRNVTLIECQEKDKASCLYNSWFVEDTFSTTDSDGDSVTESMDPILHLYYDDRIAKEEIGPTIRDQKIKIRENKVHVGDLTMIFHTRYDMEAQICLKN
jgi:hypothetical protein